MHTNKQIEALKKNTPMFFIVGRGRSGTTMLAKILDTHPNVLVPPESPYVLSMSKKYQKINNWTSETILNFYQDLNHQPRLKYDTWWKIDTQQLKQTLLANQTIASFEWLCKLLAMSYDSSNSKEKAYLVGNKYPGYSLVIDDLAKLMPQAKFIYLQRDYRDNILSYQKAKVELTTWTSFYAQRWKVFNQKMLHFTQKNEDKVHVIRYEDLAANPNQEMKAICDFLAIPFAPEMLDFYTTIHSQKDVEGVRMSNFKKLIEPVNTSSVQKYLTEMPIEDIKIAEYIGGSMGKKMGYKPLSKPLLSTIFSFKYWAGIGLATLYNQLEKFAYRTSPVIRYRLMHLIYNTFSFFTKAQQSDFTANYLKESVNNFD